MPEDLSGLGQKVPFLHLSIQIFRHANYVYCAFISLVRIQHIPVILLQ